MTRDRRPKRLGDKIHKMKTFMKILMILLVIAAILVGLYEQGKDQPNLYVMSATIVVFMFAAMKLGGKIPSKNRDKEDDHVL